MRWMCVLVSVCFIASLTILHLSAFPSQSLLDGLDEVDPTLWRDVLTLQRNWIGECDGHRVDFNVVQVGVCVYLYVCVCMCHTAPLTTFLRYHSYFFCRLNMSSCKTIL